MVNLFSVFRYVNAEKGQTVDINKMMQAIKAHPDFDSVGMVLCHNGVVRATSRDGRKVKGLRVAVDHEKLRINNSNTIARNNEKHENKIYEKSL